MTGPVTRARPRITQRGQALVLGMMLAATVSAALAMLYALGRTVEARARLIHAADAAAYSGALEQARQLNFLAYANRTQIAHQIAMAHLVTLGASLSFERTLAGQRRRNNPPARLLSSLFGRDVALAYGAARTEPGAQVELMRAYAEHDRVVHEVLEAGADSAVAGLPAARERLMRAVLRANYPATGASRRTDSAAAAANAPTIRLLSDGWPEFLLHRAALPGSALRLAVERAAGRYGFLGNRDGTRANPTTVNAQCPLARHRLRRRGATWLGADGRWGALDTQSFHSQRFNRWAGCYYREYAMGWGVVSGPGSAGPDGLEYVENPPGDFTSQDFWQWVRRSTAWDVRDGTGNPLANSYAMAQVQPWPGLGLPGYYDVASVHGADPLRFALAVSVAHDGLGDTVAAGAAASVRGPRGGEAGLGGPLVVTSAAETYYARPEPRADGREELPTLFRPYWQARLAAVRPEEALRAWEAP
ncbi:MAG: hypothetical protein J0I68_19570 [Achromobacter sp.]|jgi:hypothetical protein|uniref:Uncharacterized protein n=2 Tax=Bacteria TaxID=2 RepID=A0A6J4ZNG0_9BURK|nr:MULTISPECIES: hypothetical protein [Achromobacter]MBN9640746.1 hypothetical protein [Achromobacter sp.]CAB3627241.1 hypothetical protein LMG26845_00387 [Achromobacter insuavis]CUJ47560.1 Uncharacterised protein [Achromobacter sp. 2789STDY5608633]CUJ80222.1 Uncharacterised protein [Achromobacter sp. 2789STDY5608628]